MLEKKFEIYTGQGERCLQNEVVDIRKMLH